MSGQTLTGQVFSTDRPISEKQGGERTVGVKPFKSRQIILHENIKSRPDPPPPLANLLPEARLRSSCSPSLFFFSRREKTERGKENQTILQVA